MKLYFEEFRGKCKNESVSFGGKCTRKSLVRRVMGVEYGIVGIPRCERCMPEFFVNPKNYLVVSLKKSKIDDPLYSDYKIFYTDTFMTV